MTHGARILLVVLLTLAAIFGANAYLIDLAADPTAKPLVADENLGEILSPPSIDQGPGMPSGMIMAGSSFSLHTHFRRESQCPAVVIISMTDIASNRTTILEQRSNWLPPGVYDMNEKLRLPEAVTPGDYRLLKKADSYCEPLKGFLISVDLPVRVVAKDATTEPHFWPEN